MVCRPMLGITNGDHVQDDIDEHRISQPRTRGGPAQAFSSGSEGNPVELARDKLLADTCSGLNIPHRGSGQGKRSWASGSNFSNPVNSDHGPWSETSGQTSGTPLGGNSTLVDEGHIQQFRDHVGIKCLGGFSAGASEVARSLVAKREVWELHVVPRVGGPVSMYQRQKE